jgi:hypothetical protein
MRLAWATSDDLPATTMRASANYLRTRFTAVALGRYAELQTSGPQRIAIPAWMISDISSEMR